MPGVDRTQFVPTALAILLLARTAHALDSFDQLIDPATAPYRIDATGFVTDSGHPKHPGDFTRYEIVARFYFDPELGEAMLEFDSGEGDGKSVAALHPRVVSEAALARRR